MEWVIALLLTLNFSLVIAIFWFWKWSIQRMHELEASVVRLKYQEGAPALQPEVFVEMKKKLDLLKVELEALQLFQQEALPLLTQLKNEPKFEETEQEREIKRVLLNLANEVPSFPENLSNAPSSSLKNIFASA